MRRSKHLRIDKVVLGREYADVHQWLDETFPKYMGFEHWKERHHMAAIEEKYKGDTARVTAAMLHVICDWASHLRMVKMPQDEMEVLSVLREVGAIDDARACRKSYLALVKYLKLRGLKTDFPLRFTITVSTLSRMSPNC